MFAFETLEPRILLAVDVMQKGSTLVIDGDDAGDIVHVDGTGFESVEVFVNSVSVGTFTDISHIKAKMRGGDDDLLLHSIDITGNVKVDMGDGFDLFVLDTSTFDNADGEVIIDGNVDIKMGGNFGDLVDFQTNDGVMSSFSIDIGKNLKIRGAADINMDGDPPAPGGDGEISEVEDGDIFIGKNFEIRSKRMFDSPLSGDGHTIDLDNVNVLGKTKIDTGELDDNVEIEDCNFVGNVTIKLGKGFDELDLGNDPPVPPPGVPEDIDGNTFAGDVKVDGGPGIDELNITDPSNFFAWGVKIKNFEFID